MGVGGTGAVGPAMGVGRALGIYTAGRFVLFAGALALLAAVGVRGLLGIAVALLVSSLVSLFVLRRQRDALAGALAARSARRSGERERLRGMLDDGRT